MDARALVNSWLARINPSDAGMVLNLHGQCRVKNDAGESCVVFVPAITSTEFLLFQDIALLPLPCDASVYEEILTLNLPSAAKRDGTLALDPHTRDLVLIYTREIAHTDIRGFCAVLENFMHAGGEVKKILLPKLNGGAPTPVRTGTHTATLRRLTPALQRLSVSKR